MLYAVRTNEGGPWLLVDASTAAKAAPKVEGQWFEGPGVRRLEVIELVDARGDNSAESRVRNLLEGVRLGLESRDGSGMSLTAEESAARTAQLQLLELVEATLG
jgi:hypothetical protein